MAARLVRPRAALLTALLVATALAALATITAPPASALTNQDYGFVSSIGPNYAPGHSFGTDGPYGVAVDAAGNVYVTLPDGMAKFNAAGTWICNYTGDGGSYAVDGAWGLDVNDSGSIVFLAEHDMNRIAMLRLDQYGSYNLVGLTGKNGGDGSSGNGNGQFSGPNDVVVDGNYLYVVDTNLMRIQKFSIDTNSNTLTWVASWGTWGSGNGEFEDPTGIAADHAGHLFVTDFDLHRVQKLSTTDGAFITSWGVSAPASDPLFMERVRGIDVDAQGNVFTTDAATTTSWVDKFTHSGNSYWQLTRFGGWGTADNQLEGPFSIAVAANGYVYVTDLWNHKIKKFARDTTPPVVNISGVPAGWVNHDVSVLLTASDPTVDGQWTSGVMYIFCSLTGGSPWVSHPSPSTIPIATEGDTPLNYFAYDNVYNGSTPTTVHIRIDKTAPTTTVSGIPAGWSNAAVTASFGSSDALSGVASTVYSTDGGATWTAGSSATISAQGTTTLSYRSTDVAGNTESPKTATVKIDTTAPTTTMPSTLPAGWSKLPVSITLLANDAGSGLAATQYRAQGATQWTPYTAPFQVTTQGASSWEYRSLDAAGNAETPKTFSLRIDSRAPSTTAYAAKGRHNKSVSLAYRVVDPSPGCGSAKVTLKIFKRAKLKKTLPARSCATNVKASFKWRCTLPKGSYTVKVYATDAAGNVQAKVGSAKLTVK